MPDIDLATVLADGEYLKRAGDVLVGDIPAAGGSPEDAVDAVAAALVEGAGIDITYDDTANTITLASTSSGGSTILDGTGPPDAALGATGNYYEDKTAGVLYGPKSATGFGAGQTPTIGGAGPNVSASDEMGARWQFARAGRITKIRYRRHATSAATVNVRVWDAGGVKLADVADTQALVTGVFEVTLPTPLLVNAADVRTLSIGADPAPMFAGANTATNTADVTFLDFRYNGTVGTFPNGLDPGSTYYLEPIFEPTEAWPVTVRTVPLLQNRTIVTKTSVGNTGVLTDAGSYLRFTGTNPTYTVPPNSSVAFPVGTQIDGIGSATAMTLIQGAGVTITKARTLVTLGAGSGWTLVKTGTDTWDAHGDFSA